MGMMDDETLRMYIEESREHLADIENDLLAIEADGADIDEELVNKVFRAAHSLKGGAGFLNLTKIKDLSHKIENVLDMIRSRELVPNSEIINILLLAFDKLRELINNVEGSNDEDISEFIVSLTGLTSSTLPTAEKESVRRAVDISLPDGRVVMRVPEFDLAHAAKGGRFIYLVEYDLLHDVHQLGKTPLDILKTMTQSGSILDCTVDIAAVGGLEDEPLNRIPFFVLFATILEPELIGTLCGVDGDRIHAIDVPSSSASAPAPSAPTAAVEPPAPPTPAPVEPEPVAPPVASPPAPSAQAPEPAPTAHPVAAAPEPAEPAHVKNGNGNGNGGQMGETSLRVNVNLLETLMNLAGELVLSRNQLLQAIAQNDQRTIQACGQRINMVTSELQEAIMLTRMQPIGNIFNKFPRVVRDLAKDLGKDVRLNLMGKEVEMDKTIIEALSDPLTHLVRNAVDHGVEGPEDRARAGKPATGVINLRAYHEAGQVNIEISDDGKGIDPRKIGASAVAKGLVTAEHLKAMSEKEMMSLVFLPGLSTAAKVTDISGRGVGMDVVKTNLDKLGGLIDIESSLGKGSTFRIKLPLTLAIIPSLLVSVGGERFAVPQVNVDELIRIPAAQVKDRIELVGEAEVLILRGEMIPVVHMADVLGIGRTFIDEDTGERHSDRRKGIADRRSKHLPLAGEAASGKDGEAAAGESSGEEKRTGTDRRFHAASDMNIVVVSAGGFRYGLVVENLHDSVEIVVKPLGRHLKQCRAYAGATIMGDGRVALILDVAGLAGVAGLTSQSGAKRGIEAAVETQKERFRDYQPLLLFRNAPEEQCAVPLDLVERVEQINVSNIEPMGGKKVMQYRGGSLPLLTLEEAADVNPLPEREDRIVIVFRLAGREVGLLATTPVDATQAILAIDDTTLRQTGIMGSAIINGKTTLLVDIFEVAEQLYPSWFEDRPKAQAEPGEAPAILLAEDSDFFRNQVKKFMEEDGYDVIPAVDGLDAWNKLQEMADKIRMVVTDIEMPNLNGYELTRNIKEDKRFSGLPVIAVTSLAGDEDMAKGREAGVDDYQIKLDKEKLMESIHTLLEQRII